MSAYKLERKRVLILGLGRSGVAAATLAAASGARVTVLDEGDVAVLSARAADLQDRQVRVCLGWAGAALAETADLVVLSPGIGPQTALGRVAAMHGGRVVSTLDFGAGHCACPLIMVTGTNGKTTTVELLVHLLQATGNRAAGGGNLGEPLCDLAERSRELDFLVVEASSFQLEHGVRMAPAAAAILNLSDDHLDRHVRRPAYLRAKLNVFRGLPDGGLAVVNSRLLSEPALRRLPVFAGGGPLTFSGRPGAAATFGVDNDGALVRWRDREPTELADRSRLGQLLSRTNVENALAALALCDAVGVCPEAAAQHLARFRPGAHRQQVVAEWNGVRCVDDSKATNPDAAAEAIAAFGEDGDGRVVWIGGGRDKRMPFDPLLAPVRRFVRQSCLIGETRHRLADLLSEAAPAVTCESLAEAVAEAFAIALPGDTILLSPACASQDMFTDYADRGMQFTEEVQRRKR